MCNALRGLPPLVERHLRDWCTLFSSGNEQVHLRSRECSPAPCTGQLWVARGRRRERERVRDREWKRRVKRKRKGNNMRETEESRKKGWNEREKKWMCEKKSRRPTSVPHYPPGPLSGNRSIWHNSQQTSLWLQMGVDGRGVKVIQGKDTRDTTDLSHTKHKEISPRSIVPLEGNSTSIQPGTFLSQCWTSFQSVIITFYSPS